MLPPFFRCLTLSWDMVAALHGPVQHVGGHGLLAALHAQMRHVGSTAWDGAACWWSWSPACSGRSDATLLASLHGAVRAWLCVDGHGLLADLTSHVYPSAGTAVCNQASCHRSCPTRGKVLVELIVIKLQLYIKVRLGVAGTVVWNQQTCRRSCPTRGKALVKGLVFELHGHIKVLY